MAARDLSKGAGGCQWFSGKMRFQAQTRFRPERFAL